MPTGRRWIDYSEAITIVFIAGGGPGVGLYVGIVFVIIAIVIIALLIIWYRKKKAAEVCKNIYSS